MAAANAPAPELTLNVPTAAPPTTASPAAAPSANTTDIKVVATASTPPIVPFFCNTCTADYATCTHWKASAAKPKPAWIGADTQTYLVWCQRCKAKDPEIVAENWSHTCKKCKNWMSVGARSLRNVGYHWQTKPLTPDCKSCAGVGLRYVRTLMPCAACQGLGGLGSYICELCKGAKGFEECHKRAVVCPDCVRDRDIASSGRPEYPLQ